MSTNISRIGAYVANFVPDNSGRTITQTYATFSNVSGTVSLVPNAQVCYYNFPNPITGALTIGASITYSTVNAAGAATVAYNSLICDKIVIMLQGGATATVTYGGNMIGTGTTETLSNNKPTILTCTFNGTEYVCGAVKGVS